VVFFTRKIFEKVIDMSVFTLYYRGSLEQKTCTGPKTKNDFKKLHIKTTVPRRRLFFIVKIS